MINQITTSQAIQFLVDNGMKLTVEGKTSLSTGITLEIIKILVQAIITSGFGFITFKLYQSYKNKTENTKLYIVLIKLEGELKKNKKLLQDILNEHSKRDLLQKDFYIDGVCSQELVNLYNQVQNLLVFKNEDPICEFGEIVDMLYKYDSQPDQLIREIEQDIQYLYFEDGNNSEEIADLKRSLLNYKKMNIYDELQEIEQKASKCLHYECNIQEGIEYLYTKLTKFNKLHEEKKYKLLDKLCRIILEKDNVFTISLKNFHELQILNNKLKPDSSKNKLEIPFNLWDNIDINLLAVHDADTYLQLDKLYLEWKNFTINISDKQSIESAYNFLTEKTFPIIEQEKKMLYKILRRTTKLFKDI